LLIDAFHEYLGFPVVAETKTRRVLASRMLLQGSADRPLTLFVKFQLGLTRARVVQQHSLLDIAHFWFCDLQITEYLVALFAPVTITKKQDFFLTTIATKQKFLLQIIKTLKRSSATSS